MSKLCINKPVPFKLDFPLWYIDKKDVRCGTPSKKLLN